MVKAACVGKASCSIEADNNVFNGDPCSGRKKQLAVKISCGSLSEVSVHTVVDAVMPSGINAAMESGSTRTVLEQVEPLPPLPPAGDGAWPAISSNRQQYEVHTLRANNHNDLETTFCWHGFQYVR
jgi:hypothetical protein